MNKLIRFNTVLSGANSLIGSIRSYPKRRTTQKLYKQWAEKSGLQTELLSPESTKAKDAPSDVVSENSFDNKLSDSRQVTTKESNSHHLAHQDSPPEDIRTVVHDTTGADTQLNNPEKARKVAILMMAEINREQLRLAILLVLLGASLVIFCLGIIILIVYTLGL